MQRGFSLFAFGDVAGNAFCAGGMPLLIAHQPGPVVQPAHLTIRANNAIFAVPAALLHQLIMKFRNPGDIFRMNHLLPELIVVIKCLLGPAVDGVDCWIEVCELKVRKFRRPDKVLHVVQQAAQPCYAQIQGSFHLFAFGDVPAGIERGALSDGSLFHRD